MTPHGKANHGTHYQTPDCCSSRLCDDRTTTSGNCIQAFGIRRELSIPQCRYPLTSPTACDQPQDALSPYCYGRLTSTGTLPRSGALLPVQSTMLRGVRSPWPNRARCPRLGLGEREEIDFFETCGKKISRHSDASASRSSASKSLVSRSRRKPAARRARLISTSTAARRLPMKPSWSCSMNYGPGSGVDEQSQAKATEGKAGTAVVTGHVRGSTAGTGLRVGVASADLPATSEYMGVTAGRDRRPIFCGGGAVAARLAHNQKVDGSSPSPATSSSDGLGTHQPGSITCGFAITRQPASGRADKSAMCTAVNSAAVARFNRSAA